MTYKHISFIFIIVVLLSACVRPSVPDNATSVSAEPRIYPDYTNVTVPANICPLNFMMKGYDAVVARLTAGSVSYTYGGEDKIIMDEKEWQELRDAARGKSIKVEVFADKGGSWTAYKPFAINVAKEDIDQYLSYRLIQPSYVAYEDLSIAQRDITSYDERDIYNNQLVQTEKDGQCINCHSYQNYKTSNMLFHARQSYGGTFIVSDGRVKKVDLKTDSTISSGVYPAWHPSENIIAFSTNATRQVFLSKDRSKVEVMDLASDLILYDVSTNEVSNICNAKDKMEVFPTWSADGRTLYYCMADFYLHNDSISDEREALERYKEIKYSIYARSFDPSTHRFGEPVMLYDAAAMGKSATLPRVSPDGRYMVFALGNYGCFHVWHPEADIYLLDLRTNAVRPLKELNSNRSESYPSFSSNGRWIMTASRRDDGGFTRPYISYFDEKGNCHKAFELPQRDPEFYTFFYRSYNRPEFMKEPVTISPREFADKAKGETQKAVFKK